MPTPCTVRPRLLNSYFRRENRRLSVFLEGKFSCQMPTPRAAPTCDWSIRRTRRTVHCLALTREQADRQGTESSRTGSVGRAVQAQPLRPGFRWQVIEGCCVLWMKKDSNSMTCAIKANARWFIASLRGLPYRQASGTGLSVRERTLVTGTFRWLKERYTNGRGQERGKQACGVERDKTLDVIKSRNCLRY